MANEKVKFNIEDKSTALDFLSQALDEISGSHEMKPSGDALKTAVDNLSVAWLISLEIVNHMKEVAANLHDQIKRGDNATTGKPVKTVKLTGNDFIIERTWRDKAELTDLPKLDNGKNMTKADAVRDILATALAVGQMDKIVSLSIKAVSDTSKLNPTLLKKLEQYGYKVDEADSIGTPTAITEKQ